MENKNKTIQRFRKIKNWGNSLVLVFNPADIKDLGIRPGDEMNISDCIIISPGVKQLKTEESK